MSGADFHKWLNGLFQRPQPASRDLPWEQARQATNALAVQGRWQEACASVRQFLAAHPGCAPAHNELGRILLNLEQPADAEKAFRRALEIDPVLDGAASNLGQALRLLGNLDGAERALRDAVRADPADAVAYNRLATVLRECGRAAEAEHQYKEALRLSPADSDILNNLGAVVSEQGRTAEAEEYFRRAVEADPAHAMAQCNLGLSLADRGLQQEAERCLLAAVNADPAYFYARISYVMNKLDIVHIDEAALERSRAAYRQALCELRDWLPLEDESTVRAAAETVGWVTPFYLPYQGRNDRELQSIYGKLLCDIMARRYPDFTQSVQMPPAVEGEPLRIGIVSAYFNDHSNWKTPIRGWIENIDPKRFHVTGYHTGFRQDRDTQAARQACRQFVEGLPFEPLARKIRDDRLHVLIFPEIGMDPVTTKLAALRLAPIQCSSWGHPDTSGMPTIDYYLSSELMEPPGGQEHYTEKLIRLPNISIHYTPPDYNIPRASRRDFGLQEHNVLYCCAQSLFKYLPQFDFIFPRIAKKVGNAQFVFFTSQKSPDLTDRFMRRLSNAFEREGLDASRHVVLMQRLNTGAFQAVTSLCDIYLDSVEWSGCNTTLESLVGRLPVITVGGSMMRGRHTYSFLKMMGLDHLIADNLEAYIDLAARLGQDEPARLRIRSEIADRLPRLYGDLSCVRALEDFLQAAVGSYGTAGESRER